MKKRPIIFGILLVCSIVFSVVHSCKAKAEGVPLVTPNPTFELPEWSFAPVTPSPEPTATPAPSEGASETAAPSEFRGLDISLQPTNIYTRQYKTAWRPANQVNTSGYTYYLFNGGGTAVLYGADIVNFSNPSRGGLLFSYLDDETWEDVPYTDFTHSVYNDLSYVSPLSINFKYESFVYAFTDIPQVDLQGDFDITYVCTVPLFTKVTIPADYEYIYEYLGINDSSIKYGSVYTYITVHGSEGTDIPYQFTHTISQFTKGIKDKITIEDLTETEIISSIDIMYVCLPFGHNEFYDALEAGFAANGVTPANSSLYGSWMVSSNGFNFQRSVKFTESRTLIERIIQGIKSIFIPDPEMLADVVQGLIPQEYDGSVGFVFQFRNTLQGFFDNDGDAILTLPKFVFKTDYTSNERGYMVWNDYTVNLTQYIDGSSTLRTIQRYVRFIFDTVITFAFFNSLFAMVCSVFGLHWYKGVDSEDIAEVEE